MTRRLLGLAVPEARGVAGLYALLLVLLCVDLAVPKILGGVIDVLAAKAFPTLGVCLFLGLSGSRNAMRATEGVLRARVSSGVLARLRERLLAKVQALSFRYHDRVRAGEVIARATRDVERVAPFFGEFIFASVELVLLLGGAAAMIFLIDRWLGAGALLASSFYLYLVYRYAVPLRRKWEEIGDTYDGVSSLVQQSVAGVRVVKTFGAAGREVDRYGDRINVYRDQCIEGELLWTVRSPFAQFCFWMAVPLTLAWGGRQYFHHAMPIGALASALFYLGEMNNRLRMVTRLVGDLETGLASAGRVFEVLDAAEALPKGYETTIGERGVNLSGGQRQRIAIARAVLSDPEVLLLDDALSSVDSHTEMALQKAIAGAAEGRTTVIIAQRLSTVLHADRIVVLDEGKVTDQGTHAELLARCGLYRTLFQGQWVGASQEAGR